MRCVSCSCSLHTRDRCAQTSTTTTWSRENDSSQFRSFLSPPRETAVSARRVPSLLHGRSAVLSFSARMFRTLLGALENSSENSSAGFPPILAPEPLGCAWGAGASPDPSRASGLPRALAGCVETRYLAQAREIPINALHYTRPLSGSLAKRTRVSVGC